VVVIGEGGANGRHAIGLGRRLRSLLAQAAARFVTVERVGNGD